MNLAHILHIACHFSRAKRKKLRTLLSVRVPFSILFVCAMLQNICMYWDKKNRTAVFFWTLFKWEQANKYMYYQTIDYKNYQIHFKFQLNFLYFKVRITGRFFLASHLYFLNSWRVMLALHFWEKGRKNHLSIFAGPKFPCLGLILN